MRVIFSELSTVTYSMGETIIVRFFFQAEDGIRYLVRSRGLGDVYKRQILPLVSKSKASWIVLFLESLLSTI